MGIVILIVSVAAGINLVLWRALFVRLDGLPWRIWNLARKERSESDGRALALFKSLRVYEEHLAEGFRAQVAEAQARACTAERLASEAGAALAAATELVRELRRVLVGEGPPAREPGGAR
jgi:hypothetical protein